MENEKLVDNLLGDYEIVFYDGDKVALTNVFISSQIKCTRTTFFDANGRTVFVAPDSSVKYIKRIGYGEA
jgi:hypothetical protein